MIFTTDVMIRGYHCDAYGHVNNARWVELCEGARWAWLDQDMDLSTWKELGRGIAVIKLAVNYRRPAHAHDIVEFRCWITKLGGRSGVCHQEAVRKSTGELLIEADVTFLLIDVASGRPVAMDGGPRGVFSKYLVREDGP